MSKKKNKSNFDDFAIEEFSKLQVQNEEFKKTNKQLLKQLEKAKHKKQDLVNAVYEAVKNNIHLIDIPKVKAPKKDTRKAKEEIAIALFSDIQLAKVTPTYNTEIAEERVLRYAYKICDIAKIQKKHTQ